MSSNEADSLRTLDNAVAVIQAALFGSALIESVDVIASGENSAELYVVGHLPDHPDITFTVKVAVS